MTVRENGHRKDISQERLWQWKRYATRRTMRMGKICHKKDHHKNGHGKDMPQEGPWEGQIIRRKR
jgi:hypothetical protein